MSTLSLGAEFPEHSYTEWRELAEATLKGADFERRLVTRTYDGIAIQPLYTADDTVGLAVPQGLGDPFSIAQCVSHADPERAARLAGEEMEGGADAVVLRIAAHGRGDGIVIHRRDDMETLLCGLDLDATPIRLDAGAYGIAMAALLAAHLEALGLGPDKVDVGLGLDPFAGMIEGIPDATHPDSTIAASAGAVSDGWTAPVYCVNGHRLHAAGASEAQELAGSLAMAVHLLRKLEEAGIAPDTAQAAIGIRLAADQDIFLTIAKFRAWSLLWARVLEACGVDTQAPRPAAVTASRMQATRDPAVNMLRATAAVFAAAVAGAGEITVAPYTSALGEPDGLARRVARNTQHMLKEESGIARVADPAAGSWYMDTATRELCKAAWQSFQAIDADGGMVASLEAGAFQSAIADIAARRERDIATRKFGLTGISEYANLAEKPVSVETPRADVPGNGEAVTVEDWAGARAAARDGRMATANTAAPKTTPLPRITLGEPFEALRARSDATLAETGARPRVFVATLGSLSDYTARASWVRNAFEAGGIEPVTGEAEGFAGSGAAIACVCGTDEAYAAEAATVASALRDAGAHHIYLAGRSSDALEGAGIDTFIHLGCDLVDLLEAAHDHCTLARGS